ncbi:sulfate/molybdate ABC transporter, ATP-binding protein [Deferribacter desulfuricans SSM1]|uniref:Sulfate/molybdate ABC transporter, ATP-binding protein n=1 Tax=Deferribacter desulfuricans (strain DSM 14783 / JCM 11476 / NBRC 101012 / SSM1) TaxID=639282 RepID=D3PA85_DEFDS|nr:ATP-binding cassette domain-containing protein [Deferribacter desulfuricans]BAI81625.1 sulfate/molybdate ABC transporter, ATP-binding protein [Deferribacter desulfuricans SSM1]
MLKIENLKVKRDSFSLCINYLEIGDKEYFVLLGETGSGKTTLLETIAGFHKTVSGKIFHNEKDITFLPPEKRGVGFVYQDYALFPNLNVKENILFSTKYKKNKTDNRFKELVNFLKLENLVNKNINTLSGGEKQRVALARALMSEPKILLLDEPLSAIDPTFRYEIMDYLKKIIPLYGITIIHVTHNFREAAYLANRIAIIKSGKIIETGDVKTILNRPKHIETAKFLGFKNILPLSLIGEKNKSFFTVDPTEININYENSNNKIKIEGLIKDIVYFVDHKKIYVDCDGIMVMIKKGNSYNEKGLKVGDKVTLSFDSKKISILRDLDEK